MWSASSCLVKRHCCWEVWKRPSRLLQILFVWLPESVCVRECVCVSVTFPVSNQPLQFGQWLMPTCVPRQRDLHHHSVRSLEIGRPTKLTGGCPFIRRISSPQLLHVATGSLPIYYHCKSPPPHPGLHRPPLLNLHKNISERPGQGSAVPWRRLQQFRLFPALEIHTFFFLHQVLLIFLAKS